MLDELIDEAAKDTSFAVCANHRLRPYFGKIDQDRRTDIESLRRATLEFRRRVLEKLTEAQGDAIATQCFGFIESSPADELLDSIKNLYESNRIRPAIQLIFTTMNSWLCAGRFDLCK